MATEYLLINRAKFENMSINEPEDENADQVPSTSEQSSVGSSANTQKSSSRDTSSSSSSSPQHAPFESIPDKSTESSETTHGNDEENGDSDSDTDLSIGDADDKSINDKSDYDGNDDLYSWSNIPIHFPQLWDKTKLDNKQTKYLNRLLGELKKKQDVNKLTWDTNTGEILYRNKKVEGSNIISLLRDTMCFKKPRPKGCNEFYMGLQRLGIPYNCILDWRCRTFLSILSSESVCETHMIHEKKALKRMYSKALGESTVNEESKAKKQKKEKESNLNNESDTGVGDLWVSWRKW